MKILFDVGPDVRVMSSAEAMRYVHGGIPHDKFLGNLEFRDANHTLCLTPLDESDVCWISACENQIGRLLFPTQVGLMLCRFYTDPGRRTGVILICLATGRAAFPVYETEDSDVIVRFERLRRVRFINIVSE